MTRSEIEPSKTDFKNAHGDAEAANLEAKLAPYVMHKLAELRWGPNSLPGFIPANKEIGLNAAALMFGPIVCSAVGKDRAKEWGEKTYLLESSLVAAPIQEFLKRTPQQRTKDAGNAVVGYTAGSALGVLAELNPYVLGATVVVGGAALVGGAFSKRAEIADFCKQVSTKTTDDLSLVQHARHLRDSVGPDVYGSLPMLIPGAAGCKIARAATPALKAELPALAKVAYENTLAQLNKFAAKMPKFEPPMQMVPEVVQNTFHMAQVNPAPKEYYVKATAHLEQTIPAKGMEVSAPFDIEKASKAITDKFNDRKISIEQLAEILESATAKVSGKERSEIVSQANGASTLKTGAEYAHDLGLAILKLSSDNCSTKGMADGLRALKLQLKDCGFKFTDVYAAHASSSGNLLGYLFRKNNHAAMPINDLDALTKFADLPKKIFLFDDFSTLKLSPEKIRLLQAIPQVIVGDLAAFEKGINYLDFAKGDQFVANKLAGLIEEAKTLGSDNPTLTTNQIATNLLSHSSRIAAQKIGDNVHVVTAKDPAACLEGETTLANLCSLINRPITHAGAVQKFIESTPLEYQPVATKLLKDGVVRLHTEDMLQRSRFVVSDILCEAKKRGIERKDVLFVTDEDPGGSTHLMNYLCFQTGLLKSSNFVSQTRLRELSQSPSAQKKMVVVMDDIIYTGTQLWQRLNCDSDVLGNFKNVAVGCLGAFEAGRKKLLEPAIESRFYDPTKVSVHAPEIYHNFVSVENPFYQSLSLSERIKLENTVNEPGWGKTQAYHMLPYMFPDNNLMYIGDFLKNVMGMPSAVILAPIGVGAVMARKSTVAEQKG